MMKLDGWIELTVVLLLAIIRLCQSQGIISKFLSRQTTGLNEREGEGFMAWLFGGGKRQEK